MGSTAPKMDPSKASKHAIHWWIILLPLCNWWKRMAVEDERGMTCYKQHFVTQQVGRHPCKGVGRDFPEPVDFTHPQWRKHDCKLMHWAGAPTVRCALHRSEHWLGDFPTWQCMSPCCPCDACLFGRGRPPYSPDFKPIENLWDELSPRTMKRRSSRIIPYRFRIIPLLKNSLLLNIMCDFCFGLQIHCWHFRMIQVHTNLVEHMELC